MATELWRVTRPRFCAGFVRGNPATINPNAVQFMASEIPTLNMVARSAGLAFATAANATIIPLMVPSNPKRVATFPNIPKNPVRRSSSLISVPNRSSIRA